MHGPKKTRNSIQTEIIEIYCQAVGVAPEDGEDGPPTIGEHEVQLAKMKILAVIATTLGEMNEALHHIACYTGPAGMWYEKTKPGGDRDDRDSD